jgi:hypothetical protein
MLELARRVVLLLFLGRGDLRLELVELAASTTYEPAEIPGHTRELVGAEDHQKEKPDDYRLLYSDTEHS